MWYKPRSVKTLRFMPLAFIAGAHGFPLFVSYLALMLTAMQVWRLVRQ